MKRNILWVLLATCLVAAVTLLALRRPADRPASPAAAATAPVIALSDAETLTVAPAQIARRIPLTGTLRASTQALVRAKLAGELVEITVREGNAVRSGARLARIDPTDFAARVREREAAVRSAEAQVLQAQRTRDNNRRLLEKNFISQNAFDNAQSGLDVAIAARDAAVAQLAQARKALNDTAVVAPIGGVVAERFVQPGEKVSPDVKLLSIVDLTRMEIEAPVPADEIARVSVGQQVTLEVEGDETPVTGRVTRISPVTAAGTRAIPVWIAVENPDARLRAGMFARGALVVEQRAEVLVVPLAALRDAGGRSFVYRVNDGRIEERTVRAGLRDDAGRAPNGAVGVVEIVEGLAAGDRIVAVNLGALRAGTAVRTAAVDAAAPARR